MQMVDGLKMGGAFRVRCWSPVGIAKLAPQFFYRRDKRRGQLGKHHVLSWDDEAKNLVVTEGIGHVLDNGILGATLYAGLTDNSPTPAAGDTLASHGGWTEFDEYTGNRQTWSGVRSGSSVTNAASTADFPITGAGGGVGGAFLATVATGTGGTLVCVAALSGGNKAPGSGDTVELTYVFTGADDGA